MSGERNKKQECAVLELLSGAKSRRFYFVYFHCRVFLGWFIERVVGEDGPRHACVSCTATTTCVCDRTEVLFDIRKIVLFDIRKVVYSKYKIFKIYF